MGGLFANGAIGLHRLDEFRADFAAGLEDQYRNGPLCVDIPRYRVDYTIHFLERFKLQLQQGNGFDQAYINTMCTSGKAIIINAASVAAGFAVMMLSGNVRDQWQWDC